LEWGVKVPLPNAEGKVLYVWFDAPIGYITATRNGLSSRKHATHFRMAENQNQIIGKRIGKVTIQNLFISLAKTTFVFHCLIFPAMLMAHEGYHSPDAVPANEFLNLETRKFPLRETGQSGCMNICRKCPASRMNCVMY